MIDRRGEAGPASGGRGGGGMLLLLQLLPRLGWPGIVLLVVLGLGYVWFGGARLAEAPGEAARVEERGPVDDPAAFVSFVLDDAQNAWAAAFAERGVPYERAELVLFEGSTRSACGVGTEEIGPFYCPRDGRVYIDLDFYRELATRFGARGDFAEAYVIAHELGHHVQRQLGDAGGDSTSNAASVRRELQADCLAGVWARSAEARGLVEPGDIAEGLGAAAAVGDDRLRAGAGARVAPETFTHGSAADRSAWFQRGYEAGAPEACARAAPEG